MIARVRGVKRKLEGCDQEESRLYRQVGARVKHLSDLGQMHAFEDVKYEHWSRKRLDRLLVDYLMRQGYGQSARALARDKGVGDLVDIDTFEQMNRVRQSLLNRNVKDALDWCTENKKELRKMDVGQLPNTPGGAKHWLLATADPGTEQSRVPAPFPAVH
jgi:macrophage erythroblast attacher